MASSKSINGSVFVAECTMTGGTGGPLPPSVVEGADSTEHSDSFDKTGRCCCWLPGGGVRRPPRGSSMRWGASTIVLRWDCGAASATGTATSDVLLHEIKIFGGLRLWRCALIEFGDWDSGDDGDPPFAVCVLSIVLLGG